MTFGLYWTNKVFVLYTIVATLLSVLIESVRINASYGKVKNVNKVVTFTIGATLFGLCLALIYTDYYYTPNILEIGLYSIFYASVRGVLYDPLLNLWTGKELNYISTKTNSLIDWIERAGLKWGFWTQRIVYLLLSLITGILFNNLFY